MKRLLVLLPIGLGVILISLLILLAGDPGAVQAGWGPSGCRPVGPKVAQASGWKMFSNAWYFYCDGHVIAGWDHDSRTYRTFNGKQWSEPKNPPWVNADSSYEQKADQNFGLDLGRLLGSGKPESYTINGESVTAKQATEAMGGADLTDDSGKLRLTVIGAETERKQVLADLDAPVLAPLKDKLLITGNGAGYAPDHWAVARTGFVATGKPTIYLQAPDGKVLHRQDDYAGGAEALAQAIRKADPNYKPEADKDQRKSDPSANLWTYAKSPSTIIAFLIGVIYLLRRKASQS